MTLEQARAFIKASYEDPRGIIYRLALETGMRMEETLGLKWSDIDFDDKKLTIQRVVVFPKEKSEKWYFYTPKTPHSIRQLDLSDRILGELKAHRTVQLGQILQLGAEYERHDLAFATDFGQPIDQANIRRRNFKRIMDSAGLSGFTPHKLRHTAASLMIARKEHPKVVQQRCGHSDVKFTIEVYSHVMPGMEKEAAERHAEALYG